LEGAPTFMQQASDKSADMPLLAELVVSRSTWIHLYSSNAIIKLIEKYYKSIETRRKQKTNARL
jgi:hypothetical protein